jgi:radical SAM superfamily enzyme YgiQ (UPF0313 family)
MIYPNNTGSSRIPLGIVYLLTILRQEGHSVKLFDITFYGVDKDKHYTDFHAKNLNYRGMDLTPYGVTYKESTMDDVKNDLNEEVEQFKPDVIGVSILEDTSHVGFDLANEVKKRHPGTKIVFGGVFCIANPQAAISHPAVDIVCIAEGEVALPELLAKLESGEDIDEIKGLWIKKENGTILKNPLAPLIDLDKLPFLDLSFVDDRHFYAVIAGHVYKMVYFGSQRGCPRKCTYCGNQLFLNIYQQNIKAYLGRKMTIPRLIDNLAYLKENYGINFFQIIDDDFMLRSLEDIKNFSAFYKERVNLPFYIQAEANNVTDEKVHYLKNAGLIAAAIGIETGNDFIMQKVYCRPTSKEASLRAFKIMHKYGIRTSANIIVGVPHEGRREIFDSINFVRKCQPKALAVNPFAPFYGTKLRDYCVEKGYLNKDYVHDGRLSPVLDMPQITKSERQGLLRTFALYAVLPKKYWPTIKKCEVFTKESEAIFASLEKLYWQIVEKRGMNYDVPGFDYNSFFEKRCQELEEKKTKP